jgi:hypothetical protein
MNIFCAIDWLDVIFWKDNESWIYLFFLRKYGPYIGVGLGAIFIAGGIFLSWTIKQLWLAYDPERSLAFEPFDYFPFIWEVAKSEEDPIAEIETSINYQKDNS